MPRAQPLVVMAADNTSAALEREVAASAVLSRLAVDAAEIRERIARALARCNFMAMDWLSWQVAVLTSMPPISADDLATVRKISWADGPQPPSVSTTMGTSRKPSEAQRAAVCLSSSFWAS